MQPFGFVCPPGAALALWNLILALAVIPQGVKRRTSSIQIKQRVIAYRWQTTMVAANVDLVTLLI